MTTNENTFKFHILDELLPIIDDTSRVLVKEGEGNYVAGVEHDGKFFAMFASEQYDVANVYASEMQKALDERFAPIVVVEDDEPIDDKSTQYYTIDELLPILDGTARPYAETVANIYVVGIEHKGELYPMHTVATAGEADETVADLNKTLERHFAPIDEEEALEEAKLLEGFSFVPSRGMTYLTVNKRNRLYLHGDIKTQLGIDVKKAKMRVLLAFNPVLQAFAIVKPTSKAVTDEMRAAGYFVSKRRDITCAKLFREFNLDQYEGQTFYADTASLSGNVVIFRR